MKKTIYTLFQLLLFMLCLSSCNDNNLVELPGRVGDHEVTATLGFNYNEPSQVNVTTRATIGVVPESRVQNLFVYVFVNGARIYSHYFDNNNKKTTTAYESSEDNCWWVTNMTSEDGETTKGGVKVHIPEFTNGNLYIVANIDADMVNISPEKLNLIHTEDEIKQLAATLNQEITSRNGYFPMSAVVTGIKATSNGIQTAAGSSVTAELERLDAKIQVYVRAAVGDKTETGDNSTEKTVQTVKDFVPESWRVIHVPRGAYVIPRTITQESDYATADFNETGYFDTESVNFETAENDTYNGNATQKHGFSFYMLENREYFQKSTINDGKGNYHLRDRRIKNSDGAYDEEQEKMWEYAPEDGTYLEIKGDVVMDVDVSSQAKTQQLTANVTYYIHLGDIASSTDNYDIERNTHYTYTITIHGVDKILLEVETSQTNDAADVEEDESGSTGGVYISQEDTYTFDAHYGQRVFCFDAAYIKAEEVTWFVKTPFGNEGIPPKVNGVEIPAGYDYKWVEFMLNPIESTNVYSQNNQWYPGIKNRTGGEAGLAVGDEGHLMDVVEFTEWIKTEKRKLDNFTEGRSATNESLFRMEEDPAWKDKFPNTPSKYQRWRIYVTVFVNEYYYEEHPITGVKDPMLWKQFVNQPNRLMHILCDSKESRDGASSSTGSIVTIRQRSIQTPYNINKENLADAWGCETVDETRESYLGFYETTNNTTDHGNYYTDNGLYNTVCLWNLFNLSGNNDKKKATSYKTTTKWDSYLDYERINDHSSFFIQEEMVSMRYATLMRNRDNNGNTFIDPEEVRWYIASLKQLYGLYIGGLGLNPDAQLYPSEISSKSNTEVGGRDLWRNHVICSNQTTLSQSGQYKNKYWPDMLWAEEGVSLSGYGQEWTKQAPNTLRCVRNLGLDDLTKDNIIDPLQNIPTPLIQVTNTGNVYAFNLKNINEKSLRFYTTRELEPTNENMEMSRTYYGFKTSESFTTDTYNYKNLKTLLDSGNSPSDIEGYRVPNVREAALMSLYCPSSWWNSNNILSCTYYSHGQFGDNKDDDDGTNNIPVSWTFSNNYITVNGTNPEGKLRLVQDWYPDE